MRNRVVVRRLCASPVVPGLTNDLLARLIELGRREEFDELQQLLEEFPQARSGQLMRHPFQVWYEVARRCSRDEVVSLVKALTVAERDLPNFRCGSVSPVISLYRFLLDSTHEDFTELRDWVLAHTRNQYLPFGSSRWRPASLAEYYQQTAEHEARRRTRERAEGESLAARRAARQQQREELQQARVRKRETRAALIQSLQALSPAERLHHIISDTHHCVTFYPSEWAALDSRSVQSLSPTLRRAAVQRLADRRKGIWKKLCEQLQRNV